MHQTDLKTVNDYFDIADELTNTDKLYKVYIASKKDTIDPIILKEMDQKRAKVYQYLSKIWNPYVAEVYGVSQLKESFVTENGIEKKLYLAVTEFVSGPTLTEYVKKNGCLSIRDALILCMQICDGLAPIHEASIIHRDIKPDNIIVQEQNELSIKIIDFGIAKEFDPEQEYESEFGGTFGYMSPESHSEKATPRADIYSIGCVLNFLLTGGDPTYKKYTGKIAIRKIIETAINEDPSSRYASVQELKRVLKHELRIGLFNSIPIIRSIPGFRTHTLWKELIAILVYTGVAFFEIVELVYSEYMDAIIFFVTCLLIPLIVSFDMGNVMFRICPDNLRHQNKHYLIFRTLITIISIISGIILLVYMSV